MTSGAALPDKELPVNPAIAAALLDWYAARRRDLPWRRTEDPYRIWVAEVMLQQTQVATVIPYYERFLARFPTVRALAEASLDQVLALWEGLGYYSRARNLHAAARVVCEKHSGQMPPQRDELLALPGIGDYTAGAILSIAFGQDVAAIDGNTVRVLCRLFDYDQDPARAAGKRALRGYAEAILPRGRAREFNQALMELGSTLCLPRAPLCGECPLSAPCRARALGVQQERPIPKERAPAPHRQWVASFIERDGCLLVVRRAPRGLLGGLWELPGGEVALEEPRAAALAHHLRSKLGVEADVGEHLATVQHAYSHFRLSVHVFRCQIVGEAALLTKEWDSLHWLSHDELSDYALTGVTTKVLRAVPRAGGGPLL